MKKLTLVFDLDETLCTKKRPEESYMDVQPITDMIELVNELHDEGHTIIIETARNMVTQNNNEAKVIKNVGQDTLNWLDKHGVKYDGIKFAKTYGAAYCDDKAIRPNEIKFLKEINQLNNIENYLKDSNNINVINNSIDFLLRKHYVYQWYYFNEQNVKIVFYVGKGTKLRAWDTTRNEIFNEIYKNKDCFVEIVKLFDNASDAFEFETKLTYYYLDNGQCVACKNDKRGIPTAVKGKPAWNRGPNYIYKEPHPLGKKQPKSENHKQKISLSNKGKHNHHNENNPMAKLNEQKVIEICKLIKNGVNVNKISKMYNTSTSTINRIKYKKSWTHISKTNL